MRDDTLREERASECCFKVPLNQVRELLTVFNGWTPITPQFKQYTDSEPRLWRRLFIFFNFIIQNGLSIIFVSATVSGPTNVKIQNWGFEVLLDQPYIYSLEKLFSLPDTKVVSTVFYLILVLGTWCGVGCTRL